MTPYEMVELVEQTNRQGNSLRAPGIHIHDRFGAAEYRLTIGMDGAGAWTVTVRGVRGRTRNRTYATVKHPTGEVRWIKARPYGWEPVEEFCRQFYADPISACDTHGKTSGMCCFCSSPLTDKRSTAVGYGPICAQRFGLPWGNQLNPVSASEMMASLF